MKPDLHPERLAAFNLSSTPFLKGFVQAPPTSRISPMNDKPAEALATLNLKFLHGPSGLAYTIIEFPTDESLARWDVAMGRSANGWISPSRQPLRDGVRQSLLGGANRPGLSRGRAALVGKFVIQVGAFQLADMVRRQPETKKQMLSNHELSVCMERVFRELIRRAKQNRLA